jgi:hypothetical protein
LYNGCCSEITSFFLFVFLFLFFFLSLFLFLSFSFFLRYTHSRRLRKLGRRITCGRLQLVAVYER